MKFFVAGDPVPKQSFRKTKTGGYTDPRVTAWQETIRYSALLEDLPLLTGNVKVNLSFLLKDRRRRDSDNLSKAVLDALNGIAWVDDTQVTDLHILKALSSTPGVAIEIWEV